MGQRTRVGRAKTGGKPISRWMYRWLACGKAMAFGQKQREMADKFQTHPGLLDNAAGRARFAAKHAAEPWVKYERTEQSIYTGPKAAPPRPAVRPRTFQAFRKVGEETLPTGKKRPIWRLIADLLGG